LYLRKNNKKTAASTASGSNLTCMLCSQQSKQKLTANQDTDQNVHLPFIQAICTPSPQSSDTHSMSVSAIGQHLFRFFPIFPPPILRQPAPAGSPPQSPIRNPQPNTLPAPLPALKRPTHRRPRIPFCR